MSVESVLQSLKHALGQVEIWFESVSIVPRCTYHEQGKQFFDAMEREASRFELAMNSSTGPAFLHAFCPDCIFWKRETSFLPDRYQVNLSVYLPVDDHLYWLSAKKMVILPPALEPHEEYDFHLKYEEAGKHMEVADLSKTDCFGHFIIDVDHQVSIQRLKEAMMEVAHQSPFVCVEACGSWAPMR